jgi:hypothetical protein
MMKNNQLFQQVKTTNSGRGGKRQGAGRKAGVPNKLNADIKDMIMGALQDAGGQQYLAQQARDNPAAFMGLVGKVIPKDLKVDANGQMTFTVVTNVPTHD